MLNRLLADAVLTIHLAFIAFVVIGGFLALRWRGLAWLHVPAAFWGAAIEFGGWVCPLTPMEQRLRAASNGQTYSGGFVEYYLVPLIYPPGLTRPAQIFLGTLVLIINGFAYSVFARSCRIGRS
jgi:hypothetical protein